MDQATLRLRTREQVAIDGRELLVTGARLSRQSLAAITASSSIIKSRARLVLSRARLERSKRRLFATKRRAA